MEVSPTKPNRALADAVNSRIRADARIISAKAAMWRLGGIGMMCALIGTGIGAAFFGYSYVHDPRTSVEKMADAIADALDRTTLKATGEVKLDPQATVGVDPEAEVRLAPTSIVRLDTSGTVVRLDPDAEVKVRTIHTDVPRPTPVQLGSNTAPDTKTTVVTNFTVFKNIAHGNGRVVTGWSFSSSEEAAPSHEYCYYTESIKDGVELTINLANNGRMAPKSQSTATFDRASAVAKCLWFGGGSTRTY